MIPHGVGSRTKCIVYRVIWPPIWNCTRLKPFLDYLGSDLMPPIGITRKRLHQFRQFLARLHAWVLPTFLYKNRGAFCPFSTSFCRLTSFMIFVIQVPGRICRTTCTHKSRMPPKDCIYVKAWWWPDQLMYCSLLVCSDVCYRRSKSAKRWHTELAVARTKCEFWISGWYSHMTFFFH